MSSADVIYTGVNNSDQVGSSVAGAGDVNGDAYSDFVVGASGYDSNRGIAYLLFSDYSSSTAARYRSLINSSDAISRYISWTYARVDFGASA